MAVADPVAVDQQAVLLGARLLLVGRRRRDRTGPEAGDRGHDLEDRARHVPAESGARQQRLGRIVLEGGERRLRGLRVRDRRGVVGRRRRERQHLAGPWIQHDDGTAVLAECADRGLLEVVRDRQRQVLRVERVRAELRERIRERVAGQAAQLGVVGPLQAGLAVLARGVADDLADRRPGIDAIELAVRVGLVAGQDGAVPVQDPAARHGSSRGDDRGVVGRSREVRRADHPPVARRAREQRERRRQDHGDVHRRPRDRPAGPVRPEHQAAPRRPSRRQRDCAPGGGGGSTPLSESARSRPITRPLASSDEPP